MPRIRKKTSNRQSTADRRKIIGKARETRKKKVKAAKKNPQWKSKHKKDPGIPNDFPYKDQILAEVAEQRRLVCLIPMLPMGIEIDEAFAPISAIQAVEEKEKRKEEKRLARQQTKADSKQTEDHEEGISGEEVDESSSSTTKRNLDVGVDAIASLSAKLINPKLTTKEKQPKQTQVVDNDEEEAPVLVNRDLPNLKTVLDGSDVLLEVLDARDPLPFRSASLEKAMEGKKILLVVNKIDLCPRETLSSWLTYLRRDHPSFLFRSATAFLPAALEASTPVQGKGKGKASFPKNDALGSEAILSQLSSWAAEKEKEGGTLRVAVTGLANAGKSSFINSLLQKSSLPVYSLPTSSRGPTTTALPQEVTIEAEGKSIHFIDTPGITLYANLPDTTDENDSSLEGHRARDILLRSKGRIDRLKDPSSAVAHIVGRASAEDLMLLYSLPAFTRGDATAFLSGVARSNQLVKKRGELDLAGASKIVLRDWNTGKFARYTSPPNVDGGAAPAPLTEADEQILSHSRTRKEMRKDGGLVKLRASELERRVVPLENPWEADESDDDVDQNMELDEEEEGDEEERGSDSGDDDGTSQNEDEDNEEQEESSEEEVEPSPPKPLNQKRKRAASFMSAQPAKKVAFASRKQNTSAQPPVKNNKRGQEDDDLQEPKSILKKITVPKQKAQKPLASKPTKKVPVKVANVSSSSKNKASVSNISDDPTAYDFRKFF
ncbi:hypothetical protein NP233_g3595 [Leucocoprinus birnbaumii]|uniref:CP-type G domain-containing protein n=1 Tax=Leucocoprinus birnbaumii TaxID=56174 RepID=A0AAD5YWA7_9AGAR|nr:hypothetical protein NP233_g3595 [Leucocoprinus birnbaumii]